MSNREYVQLLSEDGEPIGIADKAEVHDHNTRLHLAFSCHITDEQGRILLTRRALSKVAWPGVWTNAFCGHPAPGESFESAISRRAADELGTTVTDITPLLPDFRYRAVDASGIVEYEICPVFSATLSADLVPNPDEVAEYRWVEPADLAQLAKIAPWSISPWLVEQLEQLDA